MASARTSATFCWSSSPSCESTATSLTTSNAATTPRPPRTRPSRSRHPRSPPCSTKKAASSSRRVPANISSRHPNSASTCPTSRARTPRGEPAAHLNRAESCDVFFTAREVIYSGLQNGRRLASCHGTSGETLALKVAASFP